MYLVLRSKIKIQKLKTKSNHLQGMSKNFNLVFYSVRVVKTSKDFFAFNF